MKWPLVSARAYALLLDERDRLREQNDRLTDHVTRMDRLEHGAGEIPPSLKPLEPMPDEIVAMIRKFDTGTIRERLTSDAWKMRRREGSWDPVLEALRQATNGERGANADST